MQIEADYRIAQLLLLSYFKGKQLQLEKKSFKNTEKRCFGKLLLMMRNLNLKLKLHVNDIEIQLY